MRIAVNSLPQELRSLRLRPSIAVRRYCEHMFVPRPRPSDDTSAVSRLLGRGFSDYEIGRRTGISRSSVQRWRTQGIPRRECSKPSAWRPVDPRSYCYLLGIYLGDGYLSKASARSPVLEISLDHAIRGLLTSVLWPSSAQSGPNPGPPDGRRRKAKQFDWSRQVLFGHWPSLNTAPARSTNELSPWRAGSSIWSTDFRSSSSVASYTRTVHESSIDSMSAWLQGCGNMPIRAISSRISRPTSSSCSASPAPDWESTGHDPATRTSLSPTAVASRWWIRLSDQRADDAGGGT